MRNAKGGKPHTQYFILYTKYYSMKKSTIAILQTMVLLIMILIIPTIVQAQPGDPGGDPAPIDGGASIVAAACAGYLAKRKLARKKVVSDNK